MQNKTPAALRPAASLVVVRPAAAGFELLLLRRSERGDQNSGAWVFPGGLVERDDASASAWCGVLDDAAASKKLGLAAGGLDFFVAAVRECFEEAGLLFARDAQGACVAVGAEHGTARAALRERTLRFATYCEREGLCLAMDELAYMAHWVTPIGMPKRFDTRFFLAALPPGQTVLHDGIEVIDHVWRSPASILAAGDSIHLLRVTRAIIELVAAFDGVASLMRWAQSGRAVPSVHPRRCRDAGGPSSVLPGHPAYGELGLLDPLGSASVWSALRPGEAVDLFPGLQRVAGEGEAAHRYRISAGGPVSAGTELEFDAQGEPHVTPHAASTAGLEPVALTGGARAWLLRSAGVLFAGPSLPPGAPLPDACHGVVRAIARGHGFLEAVESLQ
ncbi:NUDIX domain-containing protein [Hydrogenophaga sp.]|uniref:NUDIX hydrolase n=1 Tax=Hydrogenophaga sp. TaxID=1904254 RepID=UPI00271CA6FB|nr:NUDIX domain-containing protein [Hydrogenophaga sp.]MDO9437525.1 NUDIX domain-containing protein [Hydrogenophaga sp.]